MSEKADLTVQINRHVLRSNPTSQVVSLPPYEQSTAPLRLKGTDPQSRGNKSHAVRVCHTRPHRWPVSPYCARPITDCSSAALDKRGYLAAVTTHYPTHVRVPRLSVRTPRRRCENRGRCSRSLWSYGHNERPIQNRVFFFVWGGRWGERVPWEGNDGTGWAASNTIPRCLT